MAREKNNNFVILGLGTFGGTLASELTRLGDRVLGIDIDERAASRMADSLSEVVIADCRDEEALREAGVGAYKTAIVAIGEDLEANILCVMHCKKLGVDTIWATALNRTHHRILTKLDVERVVLPEQEIGQHIAQMLHNRLVEDYLSMGNGYFVVRLRLPERFHAEPLSALDLEDKYKIRAIGLMRGTDYVDISNPEVRLESDDQLLVIGLRADLRVFGDDL